jgi:hypothetical protein
MHRNIRRYARIKTQLRHELVKANALQLMPNANAQRPCFIMRAQGNDCMVKARIPNAWHGEQQLSR